MKFVNTCDSHIHSNCSFDGHNSITELGTKANDLGHLYFAITDHCECDQYNDLKHNYKTSSLRAHREMLEAKKDFPNMIMGIELGQPLQNLEAANEVLERDYDFVMASLHNISGMTDFYTWGNVSGNFDEHLACYLKEIKEMVRWGRFDALAHLSYPIRYLRDENGNNLNFNNFHKEITEIFEIMIEKNIALEINCAGSKPTGCGFLIPDLTLIKLYKSIGGKLVTIGSDTHRLEYLSLGIENGMESLLEAGFTHYAVFIKHKAVMIEIK